MCLEISEVEVFFGLSAGINEPWAGWTELFPLSNQGPDVHLKNSQSDR